MDPLLLILLIACVAFAYAMVGHGGASGYLALMALAGMSVVVMRPSALVLNLFVSAISFTQYARTGHFKWRVFLPFAVLSVPAAWLGAQVQLDPVIYKRILAVCLLFAVARMFGLLGKGSSGLKPVPLLLAAVIGAVLGFASGMIGIGGGVLLSPVLLLFNWADMKTTAATSALFIFVNSASGLAGVLGQGEMLSPHMFAWIAAAVGGGLLGGWIGAVKMNNLRVKQALGIVLLMASVKLMMA